MILPSQDQKNIIIDLKINNDPNLSRRFLLHTLFYDLDDITNFLDS